MESYLNVVQLQQERHEVIKASEAIALDLRALRTAQELATNPSEVESISRQHRRALQAYARAQQRLRELNASITWHNRKEQEELRLRNKREKAERRAKGNV